MDTVSKIPIELALFLFLGMFVLIGLGRAFDVLFTEWLKSIVRKKLGLPISGTRSADVLYVTVTACESIREECCAKRDHDTELMKTMIFELFLGSQNIDEEKKKTIKTMFKGLRA